MSARSGMLRIRLVAIGLAVLAPGSAWADYKAGADAYDRGDYAHALAQWEAAAEEGDADALAGLGKLWERGEGVGQDYARAIHHYETAAAKGHALAQYRLALLNALPAHGGGRDDVVAAYMWAELASADTGSVGAQAGKFIEILKPRLTTVQQASAIRRAEAWRKEREEAAKPEPEEPEEAAAPAANAQPAAPASPYPQTAYPPPGYGQPGAYPAPNPYAGQMPYAQPSFPQMPAAAPGMPAWPPGFPGGLQPGTPLPGFPGQQSGAQVPQGGMPQAAAIPAGPDLRALRAKLDEFACSELEVETSGGGVEVRGFVSSPDDRETLAALVSQAAQAAVVEVAVLAPPLCDAMVVLKPLERRNDAAGGIKVRAGGQEGRLREGETLVVEIEGAAVPTHVQVIYFTADGHVARLLPNADDPDDRLEPHARRTVGEPGRSRRVWTIGAPFGQELIAVIASPKPLPLVSERPEVEAASSYLAALKNAVGSEGGGERSMAATAFITTQAR